MARNRLGKLRIKDRRTVVHGLMLCTLLAGFALRVHSLSDGASFSVDEMTIIARSQHTIPGIWEATNRTPWQALWVHFWAVDLGLGYDEFPMYFTSVFVGVLAIAMAYRLGKTLFGPWVGLLSAFLLAFSAYHIYWSRSLRYYGWLVVLSMAAFLCLYQAVGNNRFRAWLGYALFRTLSLYTHLSVVTIWAGDVVFALLAVLAGSLLPLRPLARGFPSRLVRSATAWLGEGSLWRAISRSRLFRLALAMGIILLLFAPRSYLVAKNVLEGVSGLSVVGLGEVEPVDAGFALANQLRVSWQSPFVVMRLFDSWLTPLHVLMMLGLVSGIVLSILHRQWRQLLLVGATIATPFVFFTLLDYKKPINSRYLIPMLPLYVVMASRGWIGLVNTIARASRLPAQRRAVVVWCILGTFALGFAGLNAPRIALTRRNVLQDWSGAGRFLEQVAQPGEMFVAASETHIPPMERYFPALDIVVADQQSSLATLYERNAGLWLFTFARSDLSIYHEQALELNPNYVEFVFRDAWHPDMDQTTSLRSAYSFDVSAIYVSPGISSPEEALALYEAWMPKADPTRLRYHLTWARAYQRLGEPGRAVAEYSKALSEGYVNDQLASHLFDARGTALWDLGLAERAIADWEKAIARARWSWQPYQHLSEAYVRLGRADAAIAQCERAAASNPGRAWPYSLLGNIYRLVSEEERAVSAYQRAIEIEPGNEAGYRLLGRIYAQEGTGDVLSLYTTAMQRNPSAAWPHLLLGQYYQGAGDPVEAAAEFQRAAELEPKDRARVTQLLSNNRWDLETMLGTVDAYTEGGALLWWPDRTWVKPHPDEGTVMVGRSTLAVEGQVRPHQLLLHPFGGEERTYLRFQIARNPFAYLHVGSGLADRVAGLGNGVDYEIGVRRSGDTEYEPLLTETVTENLWQERVVSLAQYWGDDLEFRLAVDARGDYAYDWLQATVELEPPSDVVWDLSANLDEARFQPEALPLEWRRDGLYSADGSQLLGRSELTVGGQSLLDQVHFHPYDAEIDSTIVFTLPHQVYHSLKTSFALADAAAAASNGVGYTVSVRADGEEVFTDLVHTTVTTNRWNSVLVDLPPAQDLVLKLSSSARQDATFDWLQVRLVLLPFGGGQEGSQAMIEAGRVQPVQGFLDHEASGDDH